MAEQTGIVGRFLPGDWDKIHYAKAFRVRAARPRVPQYDGIDERPGAQEAVAGHGRSLGNAGERTTPAAPQASTERTGPANGGRIAGPGRRAFFMIIER